MTDKFKRGLILGFSIFGILFILFLSIALFVNRRYAQHDMKTWNQDVSFTKASPWGSTSFQINVAEMKKRDPVWAQHFKQSARDINEELDASFNLSPRLCGDGISSCEKHSVLNLATVDVYPAHELLYDAKYKDRAFCRYQTLTPGQLVDFDTYAKIVPVDVHEGVRVTRFVIHVCDKKFAKTMTYWNTELRKNLQRFGKKHIAKHELYHLFFHKHVEVNGGIIDNTAYGLVLGKGALDIFRKNILPGYAAKGHINP